MLELSKEENFINQITEKIIGCAIEVHKGLGPGLLESAYEECLCYELNRIGLKFERQVPLPVVYKGVKLDCGYRMDVVVENLVIVEVKAIESLIPVHEAQLLSDFEKRIKTPCKQSLKISLRLRVSAVKS
jgi:GxxExxY protein